MDKRCMFVIEERHSDDSKERNGWSEWDGLEGFYCRPEAQKKAEAYGRASGIQCRVVKYVPQETTNE